MYTAVQPLAISGQLKASTLSPKPLCPALAAVLFGAMAGVEAPNPGAAEPVQRQHQQPLSLILKTVPAGISKIVLKWIPGEWHLISRTGSFNNQVMSPLNVHVRGLRQRPSDQPSRAICDPSTPSRLGRGRPPPAAPLTSPPRATRSFAVIWLSSERSGRLYAYHSAALACAWRAYSRINQSSRH